MADVVHRLRRPEYTGENRCLPCTVVNTVIALALAIAILFVGVAVEATVVGAVLALAVVAVSAVAIYLRGYLVPGTPTLTKRYLPRWLLRAFGKAEGETDAFAGDGSDSTAGLDPERLLVEAGALEPCADVDDLCLSDSFRREWLDSLETTREGGTDRERLISVLDAESLDPSFREFSTGFEAHADGTRLGRWESHAAFLADVAAAPILADRLSSWDELSVRERGNLLGGLRLFLETCPDCDADLSFGTRTVESCCSTREVAAVSCDACGARLFETEAL